MAKKRKNPSARDRRLLNARRSAFKRAAADPYCGVAVDWGRLRPPIATEDLAALLPLPPILTHVRPDNGRPAVLDQSPARSWIQCTGEAHDGDDEGIVDHLERWPFQMAIAEQEAQGEPRWTCLRLLARGYGFSVADTARLMAGMEDKGLLYWHAKTNTVVADMPSFDPCATAEEIRAGIDAFLAERAAEPAALQAARRWARVRAVYE